MVNSLSPPEVLRFGQRWPDNEILRQVGVSNSSLVTWNAVECIDSSWSPDHVSLELAESFHARRCSVCADVRAKLPRLGGQRMDPFLCSPFSFSVVSPSQ